MNDYDAQYRLAKILENYKVCPISSVILGFMGTKYFKLLSQLDSFDCHTWLGELESIIQGQQVAVFIPENTRLLLTIKEYKQRGTEIKYGCHLFDLGIESPYFFSIPKVSVGKHILQLWAQSELYEKIDEILSVVKDVKTCPKCFGLLRYEETRDGDYFLTCNRDNHYIEGNITPENSPFRQECNGVHDKKCTKCGAKMVQRKAKNGPKKDSIFWGCSAFPGCRHTEVYRPDSWDVVERIDDGHISKKRR